MRQILSILSALALVFAGVGVVRPQTIRLVESSWDPVVKEQLRIRLVAREPIALHSAGDYIVFLEGPAGDPLWKQSGDLWVELIDDLTRKPIPATRQGVDYAFDRDGRHSKALTKVVVKTAGVFELGLGRTDPRELVSHGFNVAVSPAKVVDEQSWEARLWLIGGIAVGVVMGIVALSILTKRHA